MKRLRKELRFYTSDEFILSFSDLDKKSISIFGVI